MNSTHHAQQTRLAALLGTVTLLAVACVSYTGVGIDGATVYLTGARSFLFFSSPFVLECTQSTPMRCVPVDVLLAPEGASSTPPARQPPPPPRSSTAPLPRASTTTAPAPATAPTSPERTAGDAPERATVTPPMGAASHVSGLVPNETRDTAARCDAGDASACREFSSLMLYGLGGIQQDTGTACSWLAHLCDGGDVESCNLASSRCPR